ncbi:SIS domain protein [Mycobacterium kansasii]|uniref:Glutamine--fructose-6-phosphate aminotransferase [isomerizing] n=1 Tax=Mycobacterium kansasii TaxID=1768 RepID=A0A1V3WM97_MYCKA|nr:SIS domain protein [Mycobacterium kansasii]
MAAFIEHTRHAVELGQDQAVVITADGYRIIDFDGNPDDASAREFHIDWDLAAAEKGGYEYFMLKEIAEQPTAVADTLLGHFVGNRIVLDEQRLSDQELRDIDKVFVVACGTAYHSGLLAKYAIEHWTRLPVEVELASEFRYRDPVLDRSTLVVAVSQSGETADTLEAVRHAKEQKAKVLAICNTNGSQIPRECDAVLYTRAGPEIGVASTKTFLAQVTANYLLGLALAQARGTKYPTRWNASTASWRGCPIWWPGSSPASSRWPTWPTGSRSHRRYCSWVAMSATRWRWKVRSNSRNWPTCTPRVSRPVSSNTARSP